MRVQTAAGLMSASAVLRYSLGQYNVDPLRLQNVCVEAEKRLAALALPWARWWPKPPNLNDEAWEVVSEIYDREKLAALANQKPARSAVP